MNATNALLGVLACAGVLLASVPAGAQAVGRAAAAQADAPDATEGDDWASWIQTLEQHAQKLRELRKTEGQLRAEVQEAVVRRRPRGEEKQRLLAAHERAKKDLAEAEAQLPELIEQARQAGVPQGLLQDYEDMAEAAPANADDADEGEW